MTIKARHILVDQEYEAKDIEKKLSEGRSFEELAKAFSKCPSAKRGGDLGEVRPGQMVRVIDQVIFKKPVRVVHGPVKSQFGYHLVQVFFRD
jgi:peptidyl-prolyl cis-trans isomerase C